MNPEQFPILAAKDTLIRPVSAFAWMLLIQQNSDADAALTNFLGDKMKSAPQVQGASLPPPDFDSYPQFAAKGIGSFCIADCAWIALVRRGVIDASGPNPTEAAIMQFMQQHGAKIPRKGA